MTCDFINVPGLGSMMLCSRGQRPRKCKACKSDHASRLCDHPTGRPCKTCKERRALDTDLATCEDCNGTGVATCSILLCDNCAYRASDGRVYCPGHRGAHQPEQEIKPVADRPCKKCGRPLVFARAETGSLIPLDKGSITYTLEPRDGALVAVRSKALVTHFQTCPYAEEFTRGRRRPEARQDDSPAATVPELLPAGESVEISPEMAARVAALVNEDAGRPVRFSYPLPKHKGVRVFNGKIKAVSPGGVVWVSIDSATAKRAKLSELLEVPRGLIVSVADKGVSHG